MKAFRPSERRLKTLAHCALPLALSAAFGSAHAQLGPYYVGAEVSAGHNSNVFSENSSKASVNYVTTALIAGLDQRIGRQRLFADGRIAHNAYSSSDDEADRLDHNSHSLQAGVDWETIGNLSGRVKLGTQRSLTSYQNIDPGNPNARRKNLLTLNSAELIGRLGAERTSRLWYEAGIAADTYNYSEPDDRERESTAFSIGARYRPASKLILGLDLRFQQGTYHRLGRDGAGAIDTSLDRTDTDYKRRGIDLLADWPISEVHALLARISIGRTSFDRPQGSSSVNLDTNASGVTGSLTWNWKPTGKITTTTKLTYDTDDRTGERYESGTDGLAPGSKQTELSVGATYAATAKINVDAKAILGWQKQKGLFQNAVESSNNDSLDLSIGANYAPTRTTLVGCRVGHVSRDVSNQNIATEYSGMTYSCFGQIRLD